MCLSRKSIPQGEIDDRFIENPFRCSVELENTICLSKSSLMVYQVQCSLDQLYGI